MTTTPFTPASCLATLTFGLLLTAPAAALQAGGWAETFGGVGSDRATAIVNMPGGDFLVGGAKHSTDPAGDVWLARIGAAGAPKWEVNLGATGSDNLNALLETPDGGAIFCGTTNSVGVGAWVVKLSGAGVIEWQRTYSDVNDWNAIELAPGGYFVAGSIAQDANYMDACVLRLDATGGVVWQKRLGGPQEDRAGSLAGVGDGVVIAMQSNSSLPAAPGTPKINSVPFTRPLLVKLDLDGNSVWQRAYNFSGGDVWGDLISLNNGDLAVTGEILSAAFFQGDAWVARLTSDGLMLWERHIGDNFGFLGPDYGAQIIETAAGDLVVAGATSTAGAGSHDLWLVGYDAAGTLQWNQVLGGTGFDMANAMVEADDGDLLVAGSIQGITSPTIDALVLRTDSQGQMDASCGLIGDTLPNQWLAPASLLTPAMVPVDLGLTTKTPSAASLLTDTHNFICLPIAQDSILSCGVNPAGSLTISGPPVLGTTISFGIHNPLATQAVGSLPVLALTTELANPGANCGLMLPGYGMAGPGATGELIVGLPFAATLFGPAWVGVPSAIPVSLPMDPGLVGILAYAQAAMFDTGGAVPVGLTEAIEMVLGL